IVEDGIVQDQRKKKEENPYKNQPESTGNCPDPGRSVEVMVFIKNRIQQHPTQGDQQDTQIEIAVIQHIPGKEGILRPFPVGEKTTPGQHSHQEVKNSVYNDIPVTAISHRWKCNNFILSIITS